MKIQEEDLAEVDVVVVVAVVDGDADNGVHEVDDVIPHQKTSQETDLHATIP